MQKLLLLLVVVVAMTTNVALGQQLKYNPVSGLTQADIQNFLNQNKNAGITISADAATESEYDSDYGMLILSKDQKAIAVFNYGCESYIVVVHKLLAPVDGSILYAYGRMLFPESFGGSGSSLPLIDIEEILKATIFKLDYKSMDGCMTMLKD